MMWGKHFESMYEGSMYGAGVAVFAVWGYVIAKARKGRVELNPQMLANTLGGTVAEISEALGYLTAPDPKSRWKGHEGRRLLKEGEYQYFLPSWEHYQAIRNEVERREYNRVKQAEHREKIKPGKRGKNEGLPLSGEQSYVKAEDRGADPEELDRIVDGGEI